MIHHRGRVGGRRTWVLYFFQAEDGIRDYKVTGVRRVLFRLCQTRGKSLETDPGQSYFIHPGWDLRVLHRETWGHRLDVIVATSAYGNYLKTIADREQPDKLLSLPTCP